MCHSNALEQDVCVRMCLFKKYFIYLFLERGEGKEKERERNINVWLPLAHHLLEAQPGLQLRHVP